MNKCTNLLIINVLIFKSFILKLHRRVHQEEKKYLCPECGYKCKWATQLKYHMTKHTGNQKDTKTEDCNTGAWVYMSLELETCKIIYSIIPL